MSSVHISRVGRKEPEMDPFLTVYGHVAIDQIVRVMRFPRDNTTEDVVNKTTLLGGTGPNVAVHAAALGVPTALCAFVGTDFPAKFLKQIASSGCIVDEVIEVDGYDTSQATIINDENMTQKVLFYQGPHGCASKLGIPMLKNASRSKYVHFVTGEPRFHIDCMSQIDASVSLDPAQEAHRIWNTELLEEAMQYTDSLFGNNYEFESLLKYLDLDTIDGIDKPLVVCTCGGKGTEAVIDGEHFHIPVVEAKRVADATGAGDSFRAGYYAGLYHGYDKHQSLVIASATASFIVEEIGALTAMPTFDQVMERADPYLKAI